MSQHNMKEMVWKINRDGKRCYVGPFPVGAVHFNSLKSRIDIGVDYAYMIFLPGLKANGAVATEADAMHTVETAVKDWFKKVLD